MKKAPINRDDAIIEAFDHILDAIGYDEDEQVHLYTREDGRQVLVVQVNRFSISRLYITGRPDGKRIGDFESYFDLIQAKIAQYKEEHGSDVGFELTADEWRTLFAESSDRYVRYLFFSGIQRWQDVERDTGTNLAVCDMARRYADDETAWGIYQHKGYILMMNTISHAELAFKRQAPDEAQERITQGIEKIGAYCKECLLSGHPEAEAITREHYLANMLRYREELVHDGRLPDLASREDPRNIV